MQRWCGEARPPGGSALALEPFVDEAFDLLERGL
jgi:hypothetical protein